METKSIYQQLLNAGCELDSHESDLYVKVTPTASRILNAITKAAINGTQKAKLCRSRVFVFTDQQGQFWYEIPFAYDPFWGDKLATISDKLRGIVDPHRLAATKEERGNVIT